MSPRSIPGPCLEPHVPERTYQRGAPTRAPRDHPTEIYLRRNAAMQAAQSPKAVNPVFRATRETCLPYLPILHSPAEDLDFFSNHVLQHDKVWVAECDRGIVGFCAFGNGWLNHLYVQPSLHRSGICSTLLRIAIRDCDTLKLWVFQQNLQAIKFYESHGFTLVRMTDGSENEERVPDALYQRSKT